MSRIPVWRDQSIIIERNVDRPRSVIKMSRKFDKQLSDIDNKNNDIIDSPSVRPDSTIGGDVTSVEASSVKPDATSEAINKHFDRPKSKGHSGKSNKNVKAKKTFKNKTVDSNTNGSKPAQNTPSSSVTKTIINKFSNFQNALSGNYLTGGYIDIIDEKSIIARQNDLFQSLNLNGTNLISRRGELLSIFSDWTSLLKVRPNPSIDVYSLDGANADKSLSSERIFTNFFKQRRPFNALYNGIPTIAATKFPDVIHNFMFLNTSGNYCSQKSDSMFNYFFTTGVLKQDLTAAGGYQTRYISRDGDPQQSRGALYGLRVPTTNSNNSRLCEASGNELSQYGLILDPGSSPKRLDGPINVSVETLNRYKQFTRMFNDIQNEAAQYAGNQKSGDNT